MPNFVEPDRPAVVLSLCSSGDEMSELAIDDYRVSHYEDACEHMLASLKAIRQNGDESPHAYWLAAVSLERVERYDEALSHYQSAWKLSGGGYSEDVQRAERKARRRPQSPGPHVGDKVRP